VKGWVIPPEHSARFVWRIEEVLDLYEEPYDEKRPVVCFDERPCQLLAEVRQPLGAKPGRPERRDHEYQRGGMAYLFVAFEPLTGWRGVEVSGRRRARDFALAVARLAEEAYPLPAGGEDPAGGGQLKHPYPGRLLRGLRRRASARVVQEGGVLLHAGARFAAEHGRDRDLGVGEAVLEAAYRRSGDFTKRSASLVRGAQPAGGERELALHHR
jgi:hypothetical protein